MKQIKITIQATLVIFTLFFIACSNNKKTEKTETIRFGQVIKVKPEKLDYYKELHANPWPSVISKLKECNIQNYSIFLQDSTTLFAYFEYAGEDMNSDFSALAADSAIMAWWQETDPCQESVYGDSVEAKWLNLERVFFME